ncbi:MAG: NADH-quinone oxidoreductase subunit M, partial [Candidatus Thiodiazotropha taylori]|nr:NADH-quinone oxidoreductase subunit M [Candidatus Thiodiazotropha taylori]MCW4233740.1 NADH-quinone oxidoreductase subunit M [Candidatus Thiodiazotropha taylori]
MGRIETLTNLPLLSTLLLLPLLGIAMIWLIPQVRARMISLITLGLALIPALSALLLLDSASSDFQMLETYPWIPALDAHFRFGIDGFSAPFLPLTVLLFIAVTLASWKRIQNMPRIYYSLLLMSARAPGH